MNHLSFFHSEPVLIAEFTRAVVGREEGTGCAGSLCGGGVFHYSLANSVFGGGLTWDSIWRRTQIYAGETYRRLRGIGI